ncbi:hypothetical protein ACH5RR_030645 [Cinchona calisaya]|uniref:F-box domain-containing protein n=1 Tax=Cinchona calisaya TaxID=153742 RepID=A0ABD2YV89_9GENT
MDSDLSNKIPDEILTCILSRLSMKDAAKTSVLSRRWEILWKFYNSCLDFDDMETKVLLFQGQKQFDMEEEKYIRWVNQVVVSHRGSTIEQFRVSFDLERNKLWKPFKDMDEMYSFPTPWRWLGHDLKSLTSLRLESVNVTEQHVSYFLSDCPLLEELSIAGAPSLCKLRVVGHQSSLKLKYLEIRDCSVLKNVEVSAAKNLVYFCQGLFATKMHFQDVPKLSSVSLERGDYTDHLVATSFKELPFPVSQLQMLKLDLFDMMCFRPFMFPWEARKKFAQLTNLHQLELSFVVLNEQSMLFVGLLLCASPRLHKLVLKYQIDWYATEIQPYAWWVDFRVGKTHWKQVVGCKYECLKEVEFLGWNGLKADVELLTHLIGAAESLEVITIDPCDPFRVGVQKALTQPPKVIAAEEDDRNRARELEAKLPQTIKFVVL